MTAVVLWVIAATLTVWAGTQVVALWVERRRPVRDSRGKWRAP